MDNFNNDFNNNGWHKFSDDNRLYSENSSDSSQQNEEVLADAPLPEHSKHPVLTFQLVLSICFLLFLFIIKFLGTPIFDNIMSWYNLRMSESVLYSGNFDEYDFSFLISSPDEA